VKDFEAPTLPLIVASASDVHDGLNVTACNVTITPDCIKTLYKFNHFRGSCRNGNQLALAGFLDEYAQHADLAQFLETYESEAVGSDFDTVLINGGLNTQKNATDSDQSIVEANLDIQYSLSLSYPTPTTYFSTGGFPPENTDYQVDNEPYFEFLTYLLSLDTIPQTISISYGDEELTVPETYAHTVCDLFAQVAARGVSVLVSSGDGGSGGDCNATDPGTLLYAPIFPRGCPFVTSLQS
jgi:tripeptidyl-peptidase-1